MENENKQAVQKFTHRYKWSGEEKLTIAGVWLLGVAMAVVAILKDFSLGFFLISGFCLAIGAYAYYLGNRRKNKSAMTVIYNPETTNLSIDGHNYEGINNYIVLNDVKWVTVRQLSSKSEDGVYTPRDILILHPKDSDKFKPASMPVRLLSVPEINNLIEPLLTRGQTADNAREAAAFGKNFEN